MCVYISNISMSLLIQIINGYGWLNFYRPCGKEFFCQQIMNIPQRVSQQSLAAIIFSGIRIKLTLFMFANCLQWSFSWNYSDVTFVTWITWWLDQSISFQSCNEFPKQFYSNNIFYILFSAFISSLYCL